MSCVRAVHLLAVLLLLAAGSARVAHADDLDIGREEQMKAAYLFNFTKFIEWPVSAKRPIRICFMGAPGVHASLTASVAGKKIGARSIATVVLQAADSWLGCDVIYLDASVDANALVQVAPGDAALTVSDADEFTRHGGVIRLFKHENRLRFDINLDNARRAGLKISSNLLKLASRVEQERAP
jgi:hypothetical protein